jgi:hypothetical protein
MGGQPDVGDPIRPVDRSELECRLAVDVDARRDLPAEAEIDGTRRAGPLGGAPAAPFDPSKFSGLIDRVSTSSRSRARSPSISATPG